jgi:hypothetical protein
MCNLDFAFPVVENFWNGPGFKVIARKEGTMANGQSTAISDYTGMNAQQKGQFFSTPSFQAMLSPRMLPQGYGTYIRYNMPDRANQAVPCDPLTYGEMAEGYRPTSPHVPSMPVPNYAPSVSSSASASPQTREGYSCNSASSCGFQTCGKGGLGIGHRLEPDYALDSGYANGNWQQVYDSLSGGKITHNALPVATMNTMDGAGNMEQVVIQDRLMFSNIRGRGLKGSDYIRGDLAITPCNTGWFSVHPNIATEVNTGAMKVMGGNGETTDATISMVAQASGGTVTALSGVDMSSPHFKPNIAGAMTPVLSSQNADIQVTSFP